MRIVKKNKCTMSKGGKCKKCKELFEDGELTLEIDYSNACYCNFCGTELLKGIIEEKQLLLNELKENNTFSKVI